ncbi:Protein of unknown function [Pyronema omphalodes CBS 100304]|uniref:Uncharacterized protein n=1 Tax=Pyronema omphalodes (strain CBS 100304) TaxID=1076935 RepID=U4L0W1_PYROM|nr:Protein of unknown function [Pyronema omphalodes CBS 100304]
MIICRTGSTHIHAHKYAHIFSYIDSLFSFYAHKSLLRTQCTDRSKNPSTRSAFADAVVPRSAPVPRAADVEVVLPATTIWTRNKRMTRKPR